MQIIYKFNSYVNVIIVFKDNKDFSVKQERQNIYMYNFEGVVRQVKASV